MPTRAELAIERRIARERFVKARIAERAYARHLAHIGRHVGAIVRGFTTKGKVDNFEAMKQSLTDYSRTLRPWAIAVTHRMQTDVSLRDMKAWKQLSQSLGSGLAKEIAKTPVGEIHRKLMAEQVQLITTIPLEAAERVHKLSIEALLSSERAESVQKEIMRSGQVSAFNAYRIARTSVSTTASQLTEARATFIGSPGYFWRTRQDQVVRPEHARLEGQVIPWNEPPVAGSSGERAHAGQIYFCRCWPEPILPDRVR
jgi:SPP1 gp7 family putative phage head morphogenesis protein